MNMEFQYLNLEQLNELRREMGEAYLEMHTIYLQESQERITKMWDAFDNNNFDQIKREAHALKSSSAVMGAKLLSELAREIEQYQSQTIPKPMLEKLNHCYQETIEELEKA